MRKYLSTTYSTLLEIAKLSSRSLIKVRQYVILFEIVRYLLQT